MRISPISNTSFKGLVVKGEFGEIPKAEDCRTKVFDKSEIVSIYPFPSLRCAILEINKNAPGGPNNFCVPLGSKYFESNYNNLLQAYTTSVQTETDIAPYIRK